MRFGLIPLLALSLLPASLAAQESAVHSGQSSFHDWSQQKPGNRWHTTVADLPSPNEDESVDNGPTLIVRESSDDLPDHASVRFPVGARVWAGWRREAVHLFADQDV